VALHHRRRRRSEAERDKRREAHRCHLAEAVEALLSSEGWARWVRARRATVCAATASLSEGGDVIDGP
jgi:hypothetical protein